MGPFLLFSRIQGETAIFDIFFTPDVSDARGSFGHKAHFKTPWNLHVSSNFWIMLNSYPARNSG